MFVIELVILFLLAILVALVHRRMIKLELADYEINLEKIEESLKASLTLFALKIFKKIKIIGLQFSNFIDRQVEKLQNATQKNKISQSPEGTITNEKIDN